LNKLIILAAVYKLCNYVLCSFLHPVTFFSLEQNDCPAPCSQSPVLCRLPITISEFRYNITPPFNPYPANVEFRVSSY